MSKSVEKRLAAQREAAADRPPTLDDLMAMLKPLEWVLVNDCPNSAICPVYEAATELGTYCVNGAGRGHGGSTGHPSFILPDGSTSHCISITGAQRLCFDHYASRVRAMFV